MLEPDLVLEIQTARSFAAPDKSISFARAFYHSAQSHAPAYDVDLQAFSCLRAYNLRTRLDTSLGRTPTVVFDDEGPKWHLAAPG